MSLIFRSALVVLILSFTAIVGFAGWMLRPPSPQTVDLDFSGDRISWITFGDHGTGNPRQWEVARAITRYARSTPVDFVALLGDNFYGHGVENPADLQWRFKFENVYSDAALLGLPFFAALGNHDYIGNELAQVEYAHLKQGTGRWQMPAKDYIVFYGDTDAGALLRIVYLDTTPNARAPAYTAMELERLLASSAPARWTAIATHTPLRSARDHYNSDALRQALLPVMTRHRVRLYMAGHDHTLQMIEQADEPLYVIAGVGGKWGDPVSMDYPGVLYADSHLGFAAVTATTENLTVTLHDTADNIVSSKQLTWP